MSSRRLVFLDAAPACRTLRERASSKVAANKPRYSKLTSSMEVEGEFHAVQQRLPSTRPIDQRWDRSRGIVFNSVKRSHDFSWSGRKGIVFAGAPATERAYDTRDLFESSDISQEVRMGRQIRKNKETMREEVNKSPGAELRCLERERTHHATFHQVGDDIWSIDQQISRPYVELFAKSEPCLPTKNVVDANGLGNFKPTAAQQAPYRSWMATLQSFYAGNTNCDAAAPESTRMPRRDSLNSSQYDNMALSQAGLETLSIHARENESESVHVDVDENLTSPSELLISNDQSFGTSLEKARGGWVLSASDNSDSESPSTDAMYQPDASESSQDGEPAVTLGSPNERKDYLDQAEESDSQTQLTYTMSPEDYRNAVIASPSTEAAFWTYKLYKNSEGKSPTIYYCTNFEKAEECAKRFLDEPVIGCDIEWESHPSSRLSIKQNLSLIQIAADGKIGLFHLALFHGDGPDKLMPPSLRHLLESPEIAKAGVNIGGDGNRLEKYLGIKSKGLFELSHLYKIVRFSENERWKVDKRFVRLSMQVQEILLLPLKKDEVRTSAWSKKLNLTQSEYAASDAYAGFLLYHKLEEKRMKMDPRPPRPAFWEENKPLRLGNGGVIESKYHNPGKKRETLNEAQKEAEVDDDEFEEYFDTVEDPDADPADLSSQDHSQSSNSDLPHDSQPLFEVSRHSSLAEHTEDHDDQSSERPGPISNHTQSKHAKKRMAPSPEVKRADAWVITYRDSLPVEYTLKVGHATLRAYHLWHQQGLDCSTIATLLRDPPLALQTVANYVMMAVQEENLAFDAQRIKEPLEILPKGVHRRYWKVLERNG